MDLRNPLASVYWDTGMYQVCCAPSNFFVLFFEASSHYVALASLEFAMKKSQPLEC